MEEDKKILKKYIEEYKEIKELYKDDGIEVEAVVEISVEDFEHIVNTIEELEKENKELKETYINPSQAKLMYYDAKKGTEVILQGFIPKSKIEDKIKELEETKLCGGKIHQAVVETEIEILKELLEE